MSIRVSFLVLAAALFTSARAEAQTTALYLDSQPGEAIGNGQVRSYTNLTATIQAFGNFRNGVSVSVSAPNFNLSVAFGAAGNVPLTGGTYESARRFPFTTGNGLDASGNGIGCNQLTGRFVVHEILIAGDGSVTRFAADFEQHCNDQGPGLFGAIRYNSTVASLVPFGGDYPHYELTITPPANGRITGAGVDCGSGGTTCSLTLSEATLLRLTATPDAGYAFTGWSGDCSGPETIWLQFNQRKTCTAHFTSGVQGTTTLFLDSEAGDPIGQGIERTLTQLDGTFDVTRNFRNGVTIQFVPPGTTVPSWRLEFASGTTTLAAGTYTGARGYPFAPFSSLSVSGHGTSCTSNLTGWFVVHEVVFGPGQSVLRFSADLEQHCSDGVPALFGAIRYHATASNLPPFGGNYPLYQLTVAVTGEGRVTGGGIDCSAAGPTCQLTSGAAQEVRLTAQADPGSIFLGWTGDCHGGATATVHVNGPKTCRARFEPLVSALPRTMLVIDSQAGDPMGNGRQEIHTLANSTWTASSSGNGNEVTIAVNDGSNLYRMTFMAPDGQALAPGPYNDTYGTATTPFSALSVSVGGNGCTGTGRFVILEIALGSNSTVQRFAADFEYHCNDLAPALFGAVRFNAEVDAVVPFGGAYPVYQITIAPPANGRVTGGGLDCGAAGPACVVSSPSALTLSLTAAPDPGYVFFGWTGSCRGAATTTVHVNGPKACGARYEPAVSSSPRTMLYWDSQPGDFIGAGMKSVYTPANSVWNVSSAGSGHYVSVEVEDAFNTWNIEFAAPTGQPLAVGSYYAARRYPFTQFNGLDAHGSGRGCNALTGRFVILEIALNTVSGVVERFAADFEQHCEDAVPGLFGAIRYNSTISSVVPFGGAFPSYRLTIVPPANGRVTGTGIDCGVGVATACERPLTAAAQVLLTATPASGYTFMGWTADCSSGGLTTTLHVNGPKRCGAVFAPLAAPGPRSVLRWQSTATTSAPARSGVLSSSNSQWSASGTADASFVSIRISGVGATSDESWRLEFGAPLSESLQVGRRYVVPGSFPRPPGTAGMSISGRLGWCDGYGEFTVRELLMSQATVVRFAVDVTQTCGTSVPTLTASLQYNVLDVGNTPLTIEPSTLRFAALHNGAVVTTQPSPQTVRITLGSANVGWQAEATLPWIQLSPASGTGSGVMTVSANLLNAPPGISSATAVVIIRLTDGSGTTRTLDIGVTLHFNGTTSPPFGFVDTPVQNTTGVTGAIPMTGWALDDLEIASLTICRAAVGGETPIADANCGGAVQIFVGNGVFIEGARPDVQAAYPNHPRAERGGWGLMLLTNMLPHGGNGTFVFHVYARDREGNVVLLGTRTMTCNNAQATAPFGAIDTPGQGETASGSSYLNFGWVLTPLPKTIPVDGSTLMVYVDGVPVGSPTYNNFRSDIATLFPGLANSNGAVGYRVLDTSLLPNGLHTIVWTATDSAGVTSGIGSRYFRVANGVASGVSSAAEASEAVMTAADEVGSVALEVSAIAGRRGWSADAAWQHYAVGRSGRAVVRGEEIDRFEMALADSSARPGETYTGYLRVGERLHPLPIGSRLDPTTGSFTWSPGVGFVGTYDLVFVRSRDGVAVARREVRFVLQPKGSGHVGAQVVVDTPRSQQDLAQPFLLGGWAVDRDAATGTGVDAVHVWAYPLAGGAPVFLGAAAMGGTRPDVAAVLGDEFRDAGFGLTVQGLTPGHYDLAVFAWSSVARGFVPAQVVRVTAR